MKISWVGLLIYATGVFLWLLYPFLITYERLALPDLPLRFPEVMLSAAIVTVIGLGLATVIKWRKLPMRYMLAASLFPAVLGLEWSARLISRWMTTSPPSDSDPLQVVVALSSLSPLGTGCALSAAALGITSWTAIFLYQSELRARGTFVSRGDSGGATMLTVIAASIGALFAFFVEHARYRVHEYIHGLDAHTLVPWIPVAIAIWMTGRVAASLNSFCAHSTQEECDRLRRLAWVVSLCAAVLPMLSAEAFWSVDSFEGAARWVNAGPGLRGTVPARLDPVARSLELFAAATLVLACSVPLWRPFRMLGSLPKAGLFGGAVLALALSARVHSFNEQTVGLTDRIVAMLHSEGAR